MPELTTMAEGNAVEIADRLVTIRYRDAHGHTRELRATRTEARAIWATRQATRREEKRWRAQHISFTDAKIDEGRLVEKPAAKGADGDYPWEGPRFHFARLLGSGPTWPLPAPVAGRCPACGGASLPTITYCLACDRSGQDHRIDPPSRRDLERRREPARKAPEPTIAASGGPLAGGLGSARPRAKLVVKKKPKGRRVKGGPPNIDLKALRAKLGGQG